MVQGLWPTRVLLSTETCKMPELQSPQVKLSVIISNKHGIIELPHELLNDLRLRNDLRNEEISRKSQNFIEI